MKKNKTLKNEFYFLVIKVVTFTFITSIISYMILLILISNDNNNKLSTNYYVSYLDSIQREIEKNHENILTGNLIDLSIYEGKIHGEVLTINGKHINGEKNILDNDINVTSSINHDIVKNEYIYRFVLIPNKDFGGIVYLLRAPFKNNISKTFIIYIFLILSPIVFFIIYLIYFTKTLYKRVIKNIKILLKGTERIAKSNYNFELKDITGKEFIKIEKAFNYMIKEINKKIKNLYQIEKERKLMLLSITHDIRTPITVIKWQMEMLNDLASSNTDLNSYTSIVNSNCNRITNLTENLSLLYKVNSINFLLKLEKINLKKILLEKRNEFSSMALSKEISIEFEVDLYKKIYYLDKSMLIRVLDNILYNSLRFTDNGKITLYISESLDDSKLTFKCVDTGIGFAEKDTSKIFEAFYQEDNYKDHCGLGLYISKQIIKNFNGKILAYNNDYGGATIEFYIYEIGVK